MEMLSVEEEEEEEEEEEDEEGSASFSIANSVLELVCLIATACPPRTPTQTLELSEKTM